VLHVPDGVVHRLVGHAGLVGTLAFDGEQLFSSSSDGSLRRWQLPESQGEVLLAGDVSLGALAIDRARHVLAVGDARGVVRFFDTSSGRALRGFGVNQGQVTSMGFTDSGALVTAGVEGTVHVFEPMGTLRALTLGGGPIDVAVGQQRVLTWGHDLPVVLYDLARGTSKQLRESGEAPAEAVISSDDQWVAFSDAKGLHVRHANEPERLFKGHSVPARSLAFSADGKWLASTGHDSQVRLWALAPTGDQELLNFRGPAGPVTFSNDGASLLAASGNGEVALATMPDGGSVRLPRLDGVVHAVELSADERYAAAAGTDVRVLLFDRATASTQWLRGPTARVSSLQFGAGWLAAGADDGVHVWSPTPPFEGRAVLADTTTQVASSPDGRFLAAKTFAGDVVVWSMPEVVERRRFHHDEYAQAMAWSPDSLAIATGSWDKQVRVWPMDGSPPRTLGAGQGRVRRVAWSPQGQYVVSATTLGELDVWGLDGSHAVGVGHHDVIRNLAITPDGTRAVTSCFDGSIGVWRLPSGELAAWHEQLPSTDYLAMARDGQSVAVGSQDGRVVLWRLASERELPSGPEALRRRLAELTSARVEVATGVLATPRQP
jgi:WD40 repeat protein